MFGIGFVEGCGLGLSPDIAIGSTPMAKCPTEDDYGYCFSYIQKQNSSAGLDLRVCRFSISAEVVAIRISVDQVTLIYNILSCHFFPIILDIEMTC